MNLFIREQKRAGPYLLLADASSVRGCEGRSVLASLSSLHLGKVAPVSVYFKISESL